jgi:hypothetical protein
MQVGTPTRFKSRPVDHATPSVASALKFWDKGTIVETDTGNKGNEAYWSITNLSFNLELLREAVVYVDLRVKNQANH